ncbi:alpha-glucosidase [Oceanobacillus sp. J11TS1]|uniref:glycoside hydrolase family 13 protein n=1 Tax=Oceanobacillus sp. J11TS1 TaxID=2807191 RepID=UPI001B233C82|nr:alpha-glucosidase [Oceanobacillus sp. J11TS1]GIO23846.1 alpha-glucosidase [Oceanobacillus sp. J11TS1]
MKRIWWKEAVAYQIYPRSFMDSNGDGIGDIQGIISKLDYLKDLGIDVIWICPIYQSPNDDNGYDISDYQAIAEEFGTMADFDELLEKVHQKGMRLIMDLVINHTSDEHPWFIESKSSKDNPYRDYYIWHPGKKNGKEPNNWESIFGGSAWKYDKQTKEYFMHIFSEKQPDLNWENKAVRKDLYKMVNWWLDKGIDGFRVDAISHIKKKPGFPDLPNPTKKRYVPSFDGHMNQDGIHEFLQEFKKETLDHYDIMTVGEANGVKLTQADDWVGEKHGVFDMIFQFDHLDLWGRETGSGLDLEKLKNVFTTWQKGLEKVGWNALFLENHDQPRSVSSWGDTENHHAASAKAFATLYFLMQGTPFIYQGQEIGMTNVPFESIDEYDAVDAKNFYQEQLEEGVPEEEILAVLANTSRDHSRTPMHWTNKENAGFTTGKPWIKVNPNYTTINVEAQQNNPESIFHFYKKLIALRKQEQGLIYGTYDIVMEEHPQIYAYTRTYQEKQWLVLVNVFAEETTYTLPEEFQGKELKLLVNNYDRKEKEKLQAYQTVVYQVV